MRESIADWQVRIDQEARAEQIAASLRRQRRAMRAWKLDRYLHAALKGAAWAAVALAVVLASWLLVK